MSKLTKAQAKAHADAVKLLERDVLSDDDKYFVLENWQESATHVNSSAGAFFTPSALASDFAIDVGTGRIIDLCAGIGGLSFAVLQRTQLWTDRPEITCVELNPDYVAVGRKIVPEANWICADVFDVLGLDLGRFDVAMSNPPFGRIKRQVGKGAPRYNGAEFEFHVIDIAAHLADAGAFILPQMSAGFSLSGRPFYERQTNGKAVDFQRQVGMRFYAGCGIDTSIYRDAWKGVSPICEVVCVDFTESEAKASPPAAANDNQPASDLFGVA